MILGSLGAQLGTVDAQLGALWGAGVPVVIDVPDFEYEATFQQTATYTATAQSTRTYGATFQTTKTYRSEFD